MIQERKNDMASIIKRKKNYSVVYNYVDENGETKQKWETWHTHKEALKRKAEIENQQHTGTFLPPSNQTITEFLYDFVSLYGEMKWGVSMYDSQTALIANYINPIIGDMEVQAVTPRAVDGYIQTLQKTKSVSTKTRKAVTTYVSDKTIEKIIKLLRCAFKQAVRWEIIARNPFDNVILPKTEYAKRDIWTADMIRLALDKCTDSKLYVAMNLSFACSLRMGEILGLTWDNVHISEDEIAADNAYVFIDKELTRASKRAIETLGEKDIYHIFTPLLPNTSTRIILKKPKTDSSIRKVWLPKTLALYPLRMEEVTGRNTELSRQRISGLQPCRVTPERPPMRGPCNSQRVCKTPRGRRASESRLSFSKTFQHDLQAETQPRRSESHTG